MNNRRFGFPKQRQRVRKLQFDDRRAGTLGERSVGRRLSGLGTVFGILTAGAAICATWMSLESVPALAVALVVWLFLFLSFLTLSCLARCPRCGKSLLSDLFHGVSGGGGDSQPVVCKAVIRKAGNGCPGRPERSLLIIEISIDFPHCDQCGRRSRRLSPAGGRESTFPKEIEIDATQTN